MNRVLNRQSVPIIAVFLLAILATVAVACGSGSDGSPFLESGTDGSQQNELSASFGLDDSLNGVRGPSGATGAAGSPGASFAAATVSASQPRPAPFPTSVPQLEGATQTSPPQFSDSAFFDSELPAPELSPLDQPQAQVGQPGQQRIIVRNVDMTIEAPNVAAVIAEIGRLTTQNGGWIVRTQNVQVYRGAIDIRVPADLLDDTLATIRGIASKVNSEISTSQDFTEEFTDTTARVQTLQDTVDALRVLFARADKIEDALNIQREITRIQSDIEGMQARINYLSESAAFSLVRITVEALPQEMVIVAGDDLLAAVGRPVRFRAEFTQPEGIEDLRIEWDFGDGSQKQVVTGVAPIDQEGRVISAPVVHVYSDDTDSPYIVQVEVTGTGESGAAKGDDVMVVTVNRVPPIQVFAGDNRIVEAGDVVKLRGSFTRPEGVENLRFTWDFGDGSAPVTVDADSGVTVAEIEHTFTNSRPQSYNVVLTVRGETASGSTEGVDTLQIRADEPESLTAGNFAPGDSSKTAVRALSSIGSWLGTALIYIGIFSPLWILAGVALFLLNRSRRAKLNRRTAATLTSN